MSTWACPLCDFSTTSDDTTPVVIRHATDQHPSYLPDREQETTAHLIDAMPALIREAWLTIGAPNPTGKMGRAPHVPGSRVPAELWTMDALRADDGREEHSKVLISRLVECSRLIWEAIDHDTRKAHPQPVGSPRWDRELSWLRKVWADAQAWLDPCDTAWIDSEIHTIRATLASIVGLTRKPRNLCPDCRAPMHVDADWLVCDAGHQHPGPGRLEQQWRRKAPMRTAELSEALRVPEGTIRSWHSRGKIKPVRTEGKANWWLPWDVVGLMFPDIVAEIEKRDAA